MHCGSPGHGASSNKFCGVCIGLSEKQWNTLDTLNQGVVDAAERVVQHLGFPMDKLLPGELISLGWTLAVLNQRWWDRRDFINNGYSEERK